VVAQVLPWQQRVRPPERVINPQRLLLSDGERLNVYALLAPAAPSEI